MTNWTSVAWSRVQDTPLAAEARGLIELNGLFAYTISLSQFSQGMLK